MRPLDRMKLMLVGLLVFSVLSQTGSAWATLIGDFATFTGSGCFACNIEVKAGVSEIPGTLFDVNVEASSIEVNPGSNLVLPTILSGTASSFEYLLSDLDWVGDPSGFISGLSLTNNGVANLTESDLSFTAHSVGIDLRGTGWDSGSHFIVNLQTSHGPMVPEPSTMLLFGTGLAGLAAWRYRKRVKS